eukprot:Pompholyxophrys_sp_v1_NODE_1_length_32789_cov_6.460653.p28 type:complete len:160 gc:universal NODE_1_length_32789_cov_6.460653:28059-27580(-)
MSNCAASVIAGFRLSYREYQLKCRLGEQCPTYDTEDAFFDAVIEAMDKVPTMTDIILETFSDSYKCPQLGWAKCVYTDYDSDRDENVLVAGIVVTKLFCVEGDHKNGADGCKKIQFYQLDEPIARLVQCHPAFTCRDKVGFGNSAFEYYLCAGTAVKSC